MEYREEVKNDIISALEDNYSCYKDILSEYEDKTEAFDSLYDEMFIDDSITGNASGSYTFSTYKAEENIAHNLDLLEEALTEFGCDGSYILEHGAEACDVTIRCYLLGECLSEVLEELN